MPNVWEGVGGSLLLFTYFTCTPIYCTFSCIFVCAIQIKFDLMLI